MAGFALFFANPVRSEQGEAAPLAAKAGRGSLTTPIASARGGRSGQLSGLRNFRVPESGSEPTPASVYVYLGDTTPIGSPEPRPSGALFGLYGGLVQNYGSDYPVQPVRKVGEVAWPMSKREREHLAEANRHIAGAEAYRQPKKADRKAGARRA